VTTAEDTPLAVALVGLDEEGDALTFSVVGSPAHGSISGTPPNVVYTPAANFNGLDVITYQVNDGHADSPAATVIETVEDTAALVMLVATDVDGDALTYSIVSAPAHGRLQGNAPNLIYTPEPDFHGSDSLTFKANDGQADSEPVSIPITVTPDNDRPVAQALLATTPQRTPVAITLAGSDPDGDALSYTVLGNRSRYRFLTSNTCLCERNRLLVAGSLPEIRPGWGLQAGLRPLA
jgi:hypothetical protein